MVPDVIEGYVEAVLPFQIRGWSRVVDKPGERVTVELIVDGQTVASGVADLFREDLAKAGLGDGHCAFMLKSTAPIPWDPSRALLVRAVSIAGETAALPLARKAIERLAKPTLKVFIVGAPRSGTSVLLQAMRQVLNLPGHGESHVMPLLQRVIHPLREYLKDIRDNPDDILVKRLRREELEEAIFTYIRDFYEQQYEGQSWVDKTPSDEAVHGAPLIERVFPDAKIIALKRTAVEVVDSYMKKFAGSFDEACAVWKSAMEGILIARGQCKNMIEIDQFDLANHPGAAAEAIASHIGMPEKAAALAQYLATEKIDRLSSHDPQHRLTLDGASWTAEQRAAFLRSCGPLMTEFGYPVAAPDEPVPGCV
jgi:hypothetical protein